MPNITEIISLLDELRGKWSKLVEEGKTEPEWKQKVTLNFTDKFNSKELCGLDLKVAEFLGDVLAAIPKLFGGYEALRKAALDGERYRKMAEELEADRNRYREEAEEYSDGVRMSHKAFDDITKKAIAGEVLAISLNGIDTKIGFPPRYEPREIEAFKNGWNSNDDRWSSQRDALIAAYRQAVEQKEV